MTAKPNEAFCSSCVLNRETDPQTGRCLSCGYQAVQGSALLRLNGNEGAGPRSPSQAYRLVAAPFDSTRSVGATNGLHPSDVPIAEVAPAPTSPGNAPPPAHADGPPTDATPDAPPQTESFKRPAPSAAWLAETRALIEALRAAAESLDARAANYAAEARALRNSARTFTELLAQASSPPIPVSSMLRWSKNSAVQVDACIDCGTTSRPHVARGRCRRCDDQWRHPRKGAR